MVSEGHRSQPGEAAHLRAPIILAHEPSFRVGDVEFRPATRELRCAGKVSVLEPRVMQLLIALHRAGGAVVNKDDLLHACWDGRVVGDDAINRVVSRLRAVAKKEASDQFHVETITRVGYRLVSESHEGLGPPADQTLLTKKLAEGRGVARRGPVLAIAGLVLLALAGVGWRWLRPPAAAAHSMMVQLTGFRSLTGDLPHAMRDSINAEITAAFNGDGVIGVSTEKVPANGTSPAYSLDGSIYRAGDTIRVITRFANSRSGAVLWSDSVDYSADQVSKIPRKIAVDVGTVIRCGLSGAATYNKPLPDPVMGNYMRYCKEYWSYGASKTLQFAQRVVAAVPDFSWGWSGVGNGYVQMADQEQDVARANALRATGRQAEDRAIALDPRNSEALAHKAYLIDQHDWGSQENLFKRAIAAQPLDCGCEHYGYGLMLENVGRLGASIDHFRAATDMLALWPDSQLALGRALAAAGRADQAKPYLEAAVNLSNSPNFAERIAIAQGVETRNYGTALQALRSPKSGMPEQIRKALIKGYQALASNAASEKSDAIQELMALSGEQTSNTVVTMLAALGAHREALYLATKSPWLFWRTSMRGVLNEPSFAHAANQLGLMAYWRSSKTKPDVCLSDSAPPFCRAI